MKNKIIKCLSTLCITILVFTACNEYSEPPLIYNPDETLETGPSITSVVPVDSAQAGIREISINGSGFAADGSDTNWVFIGGVPAIIKSVSESKIVVYRPAAAGDGLTISVVIPSAASVAKVDDYSVSEAFKAWGDFQYEAYGLMSMDVASDGTLYIGTRRKIIKLAPNGIDIAELNSYRSDFAKITDLKFGPGGVLYACIDKNEIYKIDPVTGVESEFADLGKKSTRFDFDQSGNMFVGKRDGIFVVNQSGEFTSTGIMDGTEIVEMRVYNNELYIAVDRKIVKYQIQNGTLSTEQLIVDLTNKTGFSSCLISAFNIDVNGTVLLCLTGHPDYSLFVLESDGSITPYYFAKILPRSIDQIIFANDKNLYLNRGLTIPRDSVRLYKMGMDKLGAPYIGRANN